MARPLPDQHGRRQRGERRRETDRRREQLRLAPRRGTPAERDCRTRDNPGGARAAPRPSARSRGADDELRWQPRTIRANDQGRERDERRDEHHVAAFVAGVVHRQLEQSDEDPEHQQSLGRPRRAPARRDGRDADRRADEDQPHPAEEILDDGQPRRAIDQIAERVRRLARHRHLPVVELILLPVGQDEREADRQRRAGQTGQRHPGRTRVASARAPIGWRRSRRARRARSPPRRTPPRPS